MLQSIWSFVNTTFFLSLTGFSAILIYILKRRREKRQAAKILLMDIRKVEKSVDRILSNGINSDESILPQNSWRRFKHYFVDDLDKDELQELNTFFNRASLLEKHLNRKEYYSPVQIEAKGKYIQKRLVDLAINATDDYKEKRNRLINKSEDENYIFPPNQPNRDLKRVLQGMPKITTTSTGRKIKKASKSLSIRVLEMLKQIS